MYKYIKFLILIIFSMFLCIEDIKYKKVSMKTFVTFYFITFIFCFSEVLIDYRINNSFYLLLSSARSIIIPLLVCFALFIICSKKMIPIGEGDVLFIFILFFYFSIKEVFSILITSLFLTFIISIILISIKLIINKKISNTAIPFIPAFIPGILYFIGEKL